ncbi:ThuA domain-containing protein [Aquisphaera insulae]|uniref:ThuA domain-containing protein n=1 Tax=Aquisphaera insulae TaxID=2712864 RepID=UPI00202FD66C|nr:ThuA domain-containing protein [Aquisphaera insulae]
MIRTRIAFALVVMSMVVMPGPLAPTPARAQKYAPGGAKVYLLTGGKRQHHGYRDQAFYLAESLENTGRYEVTLGEDAAILETPALRKYDLIIANADRRDPEFRYTKAQQEALLNFVRSGGGYVSIHGADNAPDDWVPEFKVMLGGVFSHFGLPDGKTKKGEYTVKIADRASPITAGLADFKIKDELYYHMQMAREIQALATVEYQGATWPVAWTNVYGSGRVFHLVFGHRDFGPGKDDPVRDANLGRLLLQGIDWAAAGKKSK